MSEKATLLTSIPPVASKPEPQSDAKVSLLSQTKDVAPKPVARKTTLLNTVDAGNTQSTGSEAVESVASESVAADSNELTGLQYLTYASFVLNLVLAGAVAIVLFKKASKLIEKRFIVSAKALAVAGVMLMLHGFFATYLYTSHLNDTVSSAPLFLTMAIWVLVGPAVGFITRNLLARGDKANSKAAFLDAAVYAVIFFLTACGVSSGIKTNAALLSSIVAGFLMIIPIARSLTAFKVAKARHKELNDVSDQVLIYGLLLIPALLPVLAFAHVCGLGDALTLFLINFITFDFILVVALSMMASADEFIPEVENEVEEMETGVSEAESVEAIAGEATLDDAVEPEPESELEPAATVAEATAPVEVPEDESIEESKQPVTAVEPAEPQPAVKPKPEKLTTGNPEDPIIQFLNSEALEEEQPAAPVVPSKPASKAAPRSLPPRKPGRPGITPPKKPGTSSSGQQSAPNAPSRLKAPAKPKKRF